MKHLHIFNPENDLALASGLDYYTAPPMAAKLGLDLQMLPAWWADDGDRILALPSPQNAQWAEHIHDVFGINIDLIDKNHLQNHTFRYRPWGWNLSLRNQLLSCCVPEEQLPQRADIKNWREPAASTSHDTHSSKNFATIRLTAMPYTARIFLVSRCGAIQP